MALPQPLPLTVGQRTELKSYLRKQNLPSSVAQRMRIVLSLADGATYREIEDSLGTTAPTISLWKKRYQEEGVVGLGTIRPGQPGQKLTPALRAKILARTQQAPPDGSTHWSLRKDGRCDRRGQGTDPQGVEGGGSPTASARAQHGQ